MAKLQEGDGSNDGAAAEALRELHDHCIMNSKLYDVFTVAGLRVDAIQPGRVLCSFTVPPRLTH
ncbi:hypothetical protein E2562_036191 [Oryza meyeriana var. granulata]|uniref:Uncharacterized protein n=1 Tax=Oryza meyeriana var. granulata TaxID=110450 RepID=A0A6G1E7C9_9ORYZ|nr:hypothetical protein E2562_036191 [Oryza meyeriana var. granulata]